MLKNPFTSLLRYFKLQRLKAIRKAKQKEIEDQKRAFMKKNASKISAIMTKSDKIVPSPLDAAKLPQ